MWNIAALVLVVAGSASCYTACRWKSLLLSVNLLYDQWRILLLSSSLCDCNTTDQMCTKDDQPWNSVPMLKKVAAEEPCSPVSQPLKSDIVPEQCCSVVHCDGSNICPAAVNPRAERVLSGWRPLLFLWCDRIHTKCLKSDGLRYPFIPRQAQVLSMIKVTKISKPDNKVNDQPILTLWLWNLVETTSHRRRFSHEQMCLFVTTATSVDQGKTR
ncbi:hypothetical protein J4Q44_G00342500 [Coregonus suidteri]|uniref:Secreted protein n=1 Tax=Coregonus suidteri TaxID=861788 RepID=A0AAN8Q879_9TELE